MTAQPRGTTALSVRAALPADAATLARFNVALAQETEALALSPETVLAGVEAVLEDPAKGCYWVAEIEGTVVGQLMLTYEWSPQVGAEVSSKHSSKRLASRPSTSPWCAGFDSMSPRTTTAHSRPTWVSVCGG